ncbi:MAG: hypothetical protein HN679_02255, partial [Candidatus Pacebacteria bacterium]|nr:hypothetical protein [Candidatus Paceibacterota bacterium]
DDCGNDCKLPFRPSSGKPVYCSQCFENRGNGNGNSGRDSRRPSFGGRDSRPSRDSRPARDSRPDRNSKPQKNYDRQLEAIEAKLNKILGMLDPKEEVIEDKVAVEPELEVVTEEPIVEIETKEEPVVETKDVEEVATEEAVAEEPTVE